MKGFDDKALVLFPDISIYEGTTMTHRSQIQIAAKKMFKYLQDKWIEPHAFVTDDLAKELPDLPFKFVSPLASGDLFFISQNCDNCGNVMRQDLIRYDEAYEKAAVKHPIEGQKSQKERFDIVCKREKFVAQMIIPTYKIVVQFKAPRGNLYKVVTKPNDERIRVFVDIKTFMPTVYLSGEMEAAEEVLGATYATRPVLRWEV